VSAIDASRAIPVESGEDLDAWLCANCGAASEVVVSLFKRASGRQTVTLIALQEVALGHGWVDTQTRRIDADRYAIRFVPRRPGSNWSGKNRLMARRLLTEGRVRPAGLAPLPPDL
jgi:uncharacterized protein YdeI (YjbR/CyaY-like superfamily)